MASLACGSTEEAIEDATATPGTGSPSATPEYTPIYDGRGSIVNPTLDHEIAADQAKPVYRGALGDFVVDRDAPSNFPPCEFAGRAPNPELSELYSSALPIVDSTQCADGLVLSIQFTGPEPPTRLGRRHFVGDASVPYEAPLDRLKLVTVAGMPAIAQLAMPSYTHTFRMAIIERFPDGDQLGIMLFIEDSFLNLDEASDLAARVIEDQSGDAQS